MPQRHAREDDRVVRKLLALGQSDQETVRRKHPVTGLRPHATRHRGLDGHEAGEEPNQEQELEAPRRPAPRCARKVVAIGSSTCPDITAPILGTAIIRQRLV